LGRFYFRTENLIGTGYFSYFCPQTLRHKVKNKMVSNEIILFFFFLKLT